MSPEKTTKADTQEEKGPDEIREEIEETRAEMGDTVEALAAKTDVKGQAKAKVEDVKETVREKKDDFAAKAKDSAPDSAASGAQAVQSTVQQNPTPFIVGGAVLAGFILGRLSRS